MVGDNAKRLLIANTVKKRYNSRAVLNLNYEPIQKGDSPLTNDDVIITHGLYYIRYEPVTKGNNYVDKPYLIKSDLFTMDKIRVTNYARLTMMAKKDKKVEFLMKFSNINEKTFGIAKAYPGLEVPISIDYVKYAEYIQNKYPDINYKQIFREVLEDDD